jgi:hypothetical protein
MSKRLRLLTWGLALSSVLGCSFLFSAAIAQSQNPLSPSPTSKERPGHDEPPRPRPIPQPISSSETLDELFRQLGPAPSPRPLPTQLCSRPMVVRSVTLTAPPPSPATPLASELPAPIWANLQGPYGTTSWGESRPDKVFAHTFQWQPPCQTGCRMGGTLTFTYRNNLQATSNTAPDAGNDKYYLYNGGTLLQTGLLYTSPSPAGQTFTKTLTLSPVDMANQKVTLVVQDDTAVVNAKLDARYCCCECQFPIQ